MPEIRMRPKHQVTLPAGIVRQAQLKLDDRLSVSFVNGAIVLTPQIASDVPVADVMAFAGIGKRVWGKTDAQVEQAARSLRDQWER